MARQTLKARREAAEALLDAGVSNRQQLQAAVPAAVELQDAAKRMWSALSAAKDIAHRLMEACSEYAHEHPAHVFDETFSVSPVGVESGDVLIDGCVYHYSRGFDGYVRTEPGALMTQEFIQSLPDGWSKEKYELDVTGIKAAADADALEAAGLKRKVKSSWSLIQ